MFFYIKNPIQPVCGEHEVLSLMSDDLCCPEYYCRAKKCDVEVYEDFLQVEDCISKTQVQSFF